ncbi:hypothetical protein DRE_01361 [Drechslerella stenobrocha 248]|uniref:Peroxin 20 n=1 Tax=Drechslerella stenobrocha 248 TaxID=1043628 RepID=W7HLS0_9PEZI|nr:hypothetical protein DRE_01361 [Drechslerella stenobrocha 248]
MASSSMCGPSNPLQKLKNHASFDRSIQQDRFRSSPTSQPSSQFRQQPHQQPGLDHEFEQFLSSSPGPSLQSLAPVSAPAPLHPQASWTPDFQRLQISAPSEPVNASPQLGGWGSEFLSQMNAAPAHAAPIQQQQQQQQQNIQLAGNSYMGMNAGPLCYTDAEFDVLFEEAAAVHAFEHSDLMDFPQREAPQPLPDTPLVAEAEEPLQETQDNNDADRDADELARTAGQLVDTLSQDTSRKFQESQFIALMKKLRDKTVKVEDGKMVEV